MKKAAPLSSELLAPQRVLGQFRALYAASRSHFQRMEAKVGLGGAQIWALAVVRDRAGLSVSELALALGIRQPTASNMLKQLRHKGLLEVAPSPHDGRALQLMVSEAGMNLLHQAPEPHSGVLPVALQSLNPQELQQLEQALQNVLDRVGVDPDDAFTPLASMR